MQYYTVTSILEKHNISTETRRYGQLQTTDNTERTVNIKGQPVE